MRHHLRELGRRHAVGEPRQLGAGDVHVDEAAGELGRWDRHRLLGHPQIEVVAGDERVDHVEVCGRDPVHRHDPPALDDKPRRRVFRALEGGEAVQRILDREPVEPQWPLVPVGKALPAVGVDGRAVLHGRGSWGDLGLSFGLGLPSVKPVIGSMV